MLAVTAGGHAAAVTEPLLGGAPAPVRAAICVSGALAGFGDLDAQAAAAGWAAVSHDAPTSPESRFLGAPLPAAADDLCRRADASAYVTAATAPCKVYHGDADPVVPSDQAKAFFCKLYEATPGAATKHRVRVLAGAGHGTRHFAAPAVLDDQRAFLDAALARGAAGA